MKLLKFLRPAKAKLEETVKAHRSLWVDELDLGQSKERAALGTNMALAEAYSSSSGLAFRIAWHRLEEASQRCKTSTASTEWEQKDH